MALQRRRSLAAAIVSLGAVLAICMVAPRVGAMSMYAYLTPANSSQWGVCECSNELGCGTGDRAVTAVAQGSNSNGTITCYAQDSTGSSPSSGCRSDTTWIELQLLAGDNLGTFHFGSAGNLVQQVQEQALSVSSAIVVGSPPAPSSDSISNNGCTNTNFTAYAGVSN